MRFHSSRAGRRPTSRQPSESTPTSRPWATSGTSVALRPSTEFSPGSSRKIGRSACIARTTSGSPSMASMRRRPSGARASAPARRRRPARSRMSSAHESAMRATSSSATSCSASSLVCERSSRALVSASSRTRACAASLARRATCSTSSIRRSSCSCATRSVMSRAMTAMRVSVGPPSRRPAVSTGTRVPSGRWISVRNGSAGSRASRTPARRPDTGRCTSSGSAPRIEGSA